MPVYKLRWCRWCGKKIKRLTPPKPHSKWLHMDKMGLCDESHSVEGSKDLRVQHWAKPVDRGVAMVRDER